MYLRGNILTLPSLHTSFFLMLPLSQFINRNSIIIDFPFVYVDVRKFKTSFSPHHRQISLKVTELFKGYKKYDRRLNSVFVQQHYKGIVLPCRVFISVPCSIISHLKPHLFPKTKKGKKMHSNNRVIYLKWFQLI